MNKKQRIEMVRAMETLARSVNSESVFMSWLLCGVADGDINDEETADELECYIDDETFAEIMGVFLNVMERANKDGGLYADGVLSK